MPRNLTCSPTEAAYIAGFFDGEGTINVTNKGQIRVMISQKRPAVLYWMKDTLGGGTVREMAQRGKQYTCWRYGIFAKEQVRAFLHMVEPYCVVKHDEVLNAMLLLDAPKAERIRAKIRA